LGIGHPLTLQAQKTRHAGHDGGRAGLLHCKHRGRRPRPGHSLGLVKAAGLTYFVLILLVY
jgi:hypothetical protein